MSQRLTDDQRQTVEQNLGIAVLAAKQFKPRCRDESQWDDVKSAAYLGLCHAVIHFDPALGVSFGRYCFRCCCCCILDSIRIRSLIIVPKWLRRTKHAGNPLTGQRPKGYRGLQAAGNIVDPDAGPQELAELDELRDCIAELPERERLIMERSLDGLCDREISEEIGLSRGQTQRIRDDCVRRLKAKFSGE